MIVDGDNDSDDSDGDNDSDDDDDSDDDSDNDSDNVDRAFLVPLFATGPSSNGSLNVAR